MRALIWLILIILVVAAGLTAGAYFATLPLPPYIPPVNQTEPHMHP